MYKLILSMVLTVGLAVGVYFLEKKTKFNNLKKWLQQLIIGIIFGGAAIFATHFSSEINGATMNVRDAAILVAGLTFGGMSGVVAGVIGGVERYFASTLWNIGNFTQIACSVSALIAGVLALVIRKFLFQDKRPSWGYCIAFALLTEIFHMLMVFVTNINELTKAFNAVKVCSLPMIIFNSVTAGLSSLLIGLFETKTVFDKSRKTELSRIFQLWLLIVVLSAFLITNVLTIFIQYKVCEEQAKTEISLKLNDIKEDIKAGTKLEDIMVHTSALRVGNTGNLLVCDKNFKVISKIHEGETLTDTESLKKAIAGGDTSSMLRFNVFEKDCFAMYLPEGENYMMIVLPTEEAFYDVELSARINIFVELLIFGVLFAQIFTLIKKGITDNIEKVNDTLKEITDGNLNAVVNVNASKEFSFLSDHINKTVDTLKEHIEKEAQRINAELEFAKSIQNSALPSVFPAYPNRHEFDIFAQMDTAKEVGGDFYDFYLLKKNTFVFLVADVSGKGIPAAMFMMRAKTIIKSLAETGMEVNEIIKSANEKLCENNDKGMFVTVFMSIIDLSTGELSYTSAGHNPPVLCRKDGEPEFISSKANLVIGALPIAKYTLNTLTLKPGDKLFLYTDGVTEATDKNNELYGEERLLNCLKTQSASNMETVCKNVKADVDAFVGDVPQFDDITMLAFTYKGVNKMKEMTVNATVDNIEVITSFVNTELEEISCPIKIQTQIDIAIDELFGNIVNYAYNPDIGEATVKIEIFKEPLSVELTFIDNGVPYDPLAKKDPNVNLSLNEREIGGLGIFMVKKTMDDIQYEYKNGKNILRIKKNIQGN